MSRERQYTFPLSNTAKTIHSDEIIARIKDLLYQRQGFDHPNNSKCNEWADECPNDAKELERLLNLRAECDGEAQWWSDEGMMLFHDSYAPFIEGATIIIDFDGEKYHVLQHKP